MKSNKKINVFVIEDEEYDINRIRNTLKPVGNDIRLVHFVSDGSAALEYLRRNKDNIDVIIMDFQISGHLKGENLIREIKKIDSTLQIIVITKMTINVSDYQFANSLLDAGAIWYCTKYPGDIEDYIYQPTDFILSIRNAAEKRKLEMDRLRTHKQLLNKTNEALQEREIVGDSEAMKTLREQIQTFAATDANVLILGQSGTGKELVAQNLHYLSDRKFEKFVPVNCGSLPDHLIESELFGFEKGAFTGAHTAKKGLFELANNGTIFLDEVTELPSNVQSSLLRVLQEGEIDKIGRSDKIKVNVRVIAASNRDVEKEIADKNFREDLYFRLNVITISVPSLSERKKDILTLFDHFVSRYNRNLNREVPELTKEAADLLQNYAWPGNVRELQNVVQRLLFSNYSEFNLDAVEKALGWRKDSLKHGARNRFWDENDMVPWRDLEERVKKEYFQFVRKHTESDAEAARILGLAPPNYLRMCRKLGIK